MIEFLDLLFFGPEIEGLQKGIAPLLIAGLGFATSGGLGGIIGSKARREEEGTAKRTQREAESAYLNFDENQDVGPIRDIYADQAQRTQEYLTDQTQQAGANQLRAIQSTSGGFGATQALLQQQTQAARQTEQRVGQIRTAGAQFVEQQRQARINRRFDIAGTALGRADHRLAAARRARQQATESLVKGIGAGVTAGVGAAGAIGKGAFGLKGLGKNLTTGLKGSGLIPVYPDQEKDS